MVTKKTLLEKHICILLITIISILSMNINIDLENRLKYMTILFFINAIIFVSFIFLNSGINTFSDVYFLYPVVFFVYSIFGPIYMLRYNKSMTTEVISNYSTILNSTYYYFYIFSFLCILIILFYNKIYYEKEMKNIYEIKKETIIFDFISFGLVIYFIINFFSKGGISLFSLSKEAVVARLGVYSKIIAYGDFWLVGYSFYIISTDILEYLKNKKYPRNYFRYIIIIPYWLLNLKLGIRRGFLFLIMMMFVWVLRQKNINYKKIIIGMVILVSILLVSALSREKITYTQESVKFIKIFGEFILPQWITYFYLHYPKTLYYGKTYLYVIPYMFPRALLPNKPEDLGIIFWREAKTNTALAFNPVAEGILNFGSYSIIITPIIIFCIIYIIRKNKNKEVYYMVMCGAVLNFNRGQFAVWIFECLMVFTVIKLMSVEFKRRNV